MSVPELWFEWNGIKSYEKGVEVTSLPGDVSFTPRATVYTVPGRDGTLHVADGAYEETQMTLSLYLPYEQGGTVAAMRALKAWLSGSGTLRLSDIPGRHFTAHLLTEIAWTHTVDGFEDRTVTVTFTVEPYAYWDSYSNITVTNSPYTLTNPGTAYSRPVLTVYGSGEVMLTVGTDVITISDMVTASPVTIDSEMMECYSGTTSWNRKVVGEFPVLMTGSNAISWTGSVTKLVIDPKWRDM